MPTADRTRQAVPRRPPQAPRRRIRPRITVHAALFVTLLVIAASLLVAAAQGPGTVEPAIAGNPVQPRAPIGDAAVRDPATPPPPTPTPVVAATPAPPTSKPPEQLTGYHWPLSRKARITGFFDYRDTGFLAIAGRRIHEGLDMTTFCGDYVHAAHAGIVVAAGRRFGLQWGFSGPLDAFYRRLGKTGSMTELPIVVVIDDGNGYRSGYVHLQDATVKPGDHVKAGDLIGHIGDTGNAFGCHLHYELFRMDGMWMAVSRERVKADDYPPFERERIDPLRVLSLRDPAAARLIPGMQVPKDPPRLTVSAAP